MNILVSSYEEDFDNINCIQDLEYNCLENEEIVKIGKISLNNGDYLIKEKNEIITNFLELEENRPAKQGKNNANKRLNKKQIKESNKEVEEKNIMYINKKRFRDNKLEIKNEKKKVCKKRNAVYNQNDKMIKINLID